MQILATPDRATELSHYLRTGSDATLRRRRAVVALSAFSTTVMSFIALFQTGVIPHLPEPPLPHLDADRIDSSYDAYAILSTPDAALGAASYAATMILAAMDGRDRADDAPLLPLALAAKVSVDAAMAAKLSVDQWTKHRAFCFWCLAAATATFATVPLALPEARAAWRRLRRRPA